MRANLPDTHVTQSFELSPDALVELYKIELNTLAGGTILCVTKHKELVWQGMRFESIAVNLTGEGVRTDGQWNRPKFSIANPDGIFSSSVAQGKTDGATITRYKVHKDDVDKDIARFQVNIWRVSKPLSVTRQLVTFELRSPLDGQAFFLPGRAYYPPEFPHVSL